MGRPAKMVFEAPGMLAVQQVGVNGFDLSHNPDDGRWYVCDWNEWGDLVTRATFQGGKNGFANARAFMKRSVPRNPPKMP